MTFLDILRQHALLMPDERALEVPEHPPVSFRELFTRTIIKRDELCNLGIPQGAIIALHLKSPGDFVATTLAIVSGAVCAPLPFDLTFEEAVASLSQMKAQVLLYDGKPELLRAARELGLRSIDLSTGQLGESMKKRGRQWRRPYSHDKALLLTTTGSIGKQKCVAISHHDIVATCRGSVSSLKLTVSDRCLNFMALNHVHGLVSGFFLPLIAGCPSFQAGRYKRSTFLTFLRDFKPTWFSTSPAIYRDILRGTDALRSHLPKEALRFIRCGSSSLPLSLAHQIEQCFGVPLIEAYGMSETLQITGNPIDKPKLGSVGRSIFPKIEIRSEENEVCSNFTTGSIFVAGPSIATDNGWFDTGDRGWLDKEGYLYLVGRKQDVINRGGENISPVEVEEHLQAHPSILDACVFAVPHDRLGEELAAVVVLTEDSPYNESDIREHLQERLSPWKHPSLIVAVRELPRTSTGKVVRREIAIKFREELIALRSNTGEQPATKTELYVADKFAHVLRLTNLKRSDDFFVLGASSIDVAELVSIISEELEEIVYPISLIKHPVVKDFARFLEVNYASALKLTVVDPEVPSVEEQLTSEVTKRFQEQFSHDSSVFTPRKRIKLSPLFILSAPRSGSTLLRIILAGHPGLFAPPELRLLQYPTLSDWKRQLSGPYSFYQDGLVQAVMTTLGLDLMSAREWVDKRSRSDFPTISVYEELGQAVSPRLFVDKTPQYALNPKILERMEAEFDEPRYLYLTRNPFDVITSFSRIRMDLLWMYGGMYSSRQLAELLWWTCNWNTQTFLKGIPAERKCNISFENLVTTPVESVMKVCSFLGIDFHECMLDVYDKSELRMTDGLVAGTRMVGDPRFKSHRFINPDVAVSGLYFSDGTFSPQTRELAEGLGYTCGETELNVSADLVTLNQQRLLVSSWSGERYDDKSLIVGRNTNGSKLPIFWCMQGAVELDRLANALGLDQPFFGMRSGHLLFTKETEMVGKFAKVYVDELLKLNPEGPFILAGNCQGGYMAFAMADELFRRGHSHGLLCLLEVDIRRSTSWDVSLFYGRDSTEQFNPFKRESSPEKEWNHLYNSVSVDLLAAAHGHFFEDPTVVELAGKLTYRIETWLSSSVIL